MAYAGTLIIGRDVAAPRVRRVNAGNVVIAKVHAKRDTYSRVASLAMFAATFAATFAIVFTVIGA